MRIRNPLLAWAVAAVMLPAPAFAQHVAPRLSIASAVEQPVALHSIAIRTEISGSLALTSVELTFFNPNRRVLEGELQFPLLDGQSVVGMAMDIDGQLRDAVPVDKARGQTIFEDVTRAQIDPALLSATQGNNYKLRVYPILPQRDKIVVLRYAETLASRSGKQVYRLPLYYGDRLPELSIAVHVVGADSLPFASGALGAAAFGRVGDAYAMEVTRRDFIGSGVLEIDVSAPDRPKAYTQVHDGRAYFHAEVPVAAIKAPRALPRSVTLVWDSSGSGLARDHGREFALLDAFFAKARNVEVRLVRIRDAADPPQAFSVANGDWRALRRALAATIYDGATNLGAFVPDPAAEEVLLFSDGLANFGAQRMAAVKVPLYVVSAAARADSVQLRHMAEGSGGRFIDPFVVTAAEAADALLTESSRLVAMDSEGATQLVAPSPFPTQRRIAVAGVLTEAAGTMRVTIVHPGGRRQVIAVPLDARRNPSALAAPMWARYRIAGLEGEYDVNRGEIRRLGKAFGLVTRETSLIVLDRVEDYARYEITPPAELMAAYQALRATAVQRDTAGRQAHLERVVKLFEDKQAWWKREFPKSDKPTPVGPKDLSIRQERTAALAESGLLDARRSREMQPAVPAAAPPLSMTEPAGRPAENRAFAQSQAKTTADNGVAADAAAATIQLRRWTPDAPYISRLRDAAAADLYRVYLDERPGYANSTAFFLDAADMFFERAQFALGVRVLSNLAEMDLENRHVLRILGLRLMQAERPELALPVFRKVLELAPEEPQSYRDLGLAYAADGQQQMAIDTLREVVVRPWHGRFPEIELITLAELNAIVASSGETLDTSRIDPRLLKNLPLALRVVLAWDADNTDIDLWVTDPNGERAYYGNRLTYQGGRMSQDFTGGYGPEEFSLKHAKPGRYKIEAQFYGNRQQIVTGATTIQAKLATDFGTARQKEQSVTMRLKDRREVVFVGEFDIAAAD